MYYFTYDPWVGKQLYMEEFYVMDQCRGKRTHLFSHTQLPEQEATVFVSV